MGTGWRADAGGTDVGREGSAFWFGGPDNIVTNNVATDMVTPGYAYGYTYFDSGPADVPTYQGADDSVPGQYTVQDMDQTPLLGFAGDTAYGTHDGLTIWFLSVSYTSTDQAIGESVVSSLRLWHVTEGFFAYPVNHLTIDGLVDLGDASYLQSPGNSSTGIYLVDYLTGSFVLKNSNIQDMEDGVMVPAKVGDTGDTGQTPIIYTIENSYLRN